MAKTYAELTQQILQLQAVAESRRLAESKGVISRMNEAIAFYRLTPGDLTFPQTGPLAIEAPTVLSPVVPSAVIAKAGTPVVAKSGGNGYSDGAGNTWTGRGPRPKWLREALAAGNSISKYEVTGSPRPSAAAPFEKPTLAAQVKTQAPVKSKVPVKYKNEETGDSWSGRGPKPAWLRTALDSGRSLEDFDVSRKLGMPAAVTTAPAPTPAPESTAVARSTLFKKAPAPIAVKKTGAAPAPAAAKRPGAAPVPEWAKKASKAPSPAKAASATTVNAIVVPATFLQSGQSDVGLSLDSPDQVLSAPLPESGATAS